MPLPAVARANNNAALRFGVIVIGGGQLIHLGKTSIELANLGWISDVLNIPASIAQKEQAGVDRNSLFPHVQVFIRKGRRHSAIAQTQRYVVDQSGSLVERMMIATKRHAHAGFLEAYLCNGSIPEAVRCRNDGIFADNRAGACELIVQIVFERCWPVRWVLSSAAINRTFAVADTFDRRHRDRWRFTLLGMRVTNRGNLASGNQKTAQGWNGSIA